MDNGSRHIPTSGNNHQNWLAWEGIVTTLEPNADKEEPRPVFRDSGDGTREDMAEPPEWFKKFVAQRKEQADD